ncbi:hypothetical protein AMTR_s00035p00239080 [Amborella trichopoda]|uniref:Uncharacterized protein n=1 Tax=Amborella trichopoda TaxID=13333 RepID=W1PVH5_AMBTC|nr:hypothetical protein AMTR_s00035p00239080 [Amborella trichopoda]
MVDGVGTNAIDNSAPCSALGSSNTLRTPQGHLRHTGNKPVTKSTRRTDDSIELSSVIDNCVGRKRSTGNSTVVLEPSGRSGHHSTCLLDRRRILIRKRGSTYGRVSALEYQSS